MKKREHNLVKIASKWKHLKYIYPSISDPRQLPVALLFLEHNPQSSSQNFQFM